MIVNLDKSSGPGTHWVAIFLKDVSHAYYFDSYGQPPPPIIAKYLVNYYTLTNSFVIQSIISSVCAHYCIYFVFHCSKGSSYPTILTLLANSNNPDLLVSVFVKKLIE